MNDDIPAYKVGFILSKPPHGDASGREGLDAILATSAYSEALALFLTEDGVYQLMRDQKADEILGRQYLPTFGLLELYDIEDIFVSAQSLRERGLTAEDLAIEVNILEPEHLSELLHHCHHLLKF